MYDTAANLINTVAAECGITPTSNPFASSDPAYQQLVVLATSAGRELLGLHTWQRLLRTHSITTVVPPDDGVYPLPTDFGYFIDQTGWDRTNQFPLSGPLSAQDWTYAVNSLAGSPIYVSFRIAEGQLKLLPDPPPTGITLTFEYIRKNWVIDVDGTTYKDSVVNASDTVLYEAVLFAKFLKLRFLEAKGFDTTAALGQFNSAFMQWTGRDISAPVLSMARNRAFPYLNWRNIPDTGYGS